MEDEGIDEIPCEVEGASRTVGGVFAGWGNGDQDPPGPVRRPEIVEDARGADDGEVIFSQVVWPHVHVEVKLSFHAHQVEEEHETAGGRAGKGARVIFFCVEIVEKEDIIDELEAGPFVVCGGEVKAPDLGCF